MQDRISYHLDKTNAFNGNVIIYDLEGSEIYISEELIKTATAEKLRNSFQYEHFRTHGNSDLNSISYPQRNVILTKRLLVHEFVLKLTCLYDPAIGKQTARQHKSRVIFLY